MITTRVTCPECAHTFQSRAGGATSMCPKCNTEFAGGRDEADLGGEKWSYRTSWLRYAVLTVLLVIMGVLGYMLYQKRSGQSETAGSGSDSDDMRPLVLKYGDDKPANIELKPLANPGSPAGGGGGGDATAPKKGRSAAEARKGLVGTWESKTGDATATVEYKDDGTFTYTATGGAKAVSGQWKVNDPTARGTGPTIEWTVEGQTIPAVPLSLRGGKIEKHPLLHRPADSGTFERK